MTYCGLKILKFTFNKHPEEVGEIEVMHADDQDHA